MDIKMLENQGKAELVGHTRLPPKACNVTFNTYLRVIKCMREYAPVVHKSWGAA